MFLWKMYMAPGKDDVKHLLEGEISEEHSPFVGTVFHTVVPKVPTVSSLRNRKG
jgi:hypothetical protein